MYTTKQKSDTALTQLILDRLNQQPYRFTVGSVYSIERILGIECWRDTDKSHKAITRAFDKLVQEKRVPFLPDGYVPSDEFLYRFEP